MFTGNKINANNLYPNMMSGSKILIIDYDVTRYHSFDLFAYLLSNEDNFKRCDLNVLKHMCDHNVEWNDRMFWFAHNVSEFNIFNLFKDNIINDQNVYEKILNEQFPNLGITTTDIDDRLGIIFQRKDIEGYILKYFKDPHTVPYDNLLKTYQSDSILDLRMAMEIIRRHSIDTIMVSSIEIAMRIISLLIENKNVGNIGYTFIIANYRYNYDKNNLPKYLLDMNTIEYRYHFTFCVFDPFTGLSIKFKQERKNKNADSE